MCGLHQGVLVCCFQFDCQSSGVVGLRCVSVCLCQNRLVCRVLFFLLGYVMLVADDKAHQGGVNVTGSPTGSPSSYIMFMFLCAELDSSFLLLQAGLISDKFGVSYGPPKFGILL